MAELTEELRRELHSAGDEPLRLTDSKNNQEYVLVRADIYDRMVELAYDASPWTDEEMDALAAEQADMLGWEGMDVYQDDQK